MICGDDTGLCKRVAHADGRVVARWGVQALGAAVHRLCVRDSIVCCGRADGAVDAFELLADSSAAPAPVCTYEPAGRARVAGLAFLSDLRLLIADEAGRIEVFAAPPTNGDAGKGAEKAKSLGLAEAGAHTAQVRADSTGAQAASGGQDHELRVWDLATMAVSWKARNVPEDMVRLAVPIWHADLAFSPLGAHTLVTASGFVEQRLCGEVRVYDVRAQRRPVMRAIAPLGDVALTALALSPDGQSAFVGTAKGDLGQLDLRTDGRLVGGLKGACGAITAIELSADGARVFSSSLDRHTRVHSARTRVLLSSAYLKQKLRSLALLTGADAPSGSDGGRARANEGDEDEGEEGELHAAREATAADAAAVEQLLGSLSRARDGHASADEEDEAASEAGAAARKRSKAKRERAPKQGEEPSVEPMPQRSPPQSAPARRKDGGAASERAKKPRRVAA